MGVAVPRRARPGRGWRERPALPSTTSAGDSHYLFFPGLTSTCHHPLPILLAATQRGHVTIVELYPLVIRIDSHPLIFAVRAHIVDINCDAVEAIGRQARLAGDFAVRCSRFHYGNYRYTRPHLGDYLLQGLHHLRLQGGGPDSFGFFGSIHHLTGITHVADDDLGIVEDLDKLAANLLLRMPGEDAAVDVGSRGLRQRVVGSAS